MTIEEMQAKRIELGFSYNRLAALSGVPLGTIQKIFGGTTTAPRYNTIRKLEAALTGIYPDVGERAFNSRGEQTYPDFIRSETPLYNVSKQGSFTLEDYYRIREHTRVQLIDGDIIVMQSPSVLHQVITSKLAAALSSIIQKNNGDCEVISPSPTVELMHGADHDFHGYEPDIIVICDTKKLTRKCVKGGPDLVVEVLSPSTQYYDLGKKQAFYLASGVREYWAVDPRKQKVILYPYLKQFYPEVYGFERVPVHIWPGEEVDFAEIRRQAAFAYEIDADGEEDEEEEEN